MSAPKDRICWPSKRLSEVARVVTGKTPKTSNREFYEGTIPFVTPADLKSQSIYSALTLLSESGASTVSRVPSGTVMVSCIGTLGKVGIAETEVCTNQQINSLIFDAHQIEPRYGFHFCRTLKPKLEAMAPSTTIPIVNKSRFSELTIRLPPLSEQRRIVGILDRVDTLRVKRQDAIVKLDQLLHSVFLELFGDPVSNSLGWPIIPLSEVCDVRDGTHDSPKYVESGYPLVTSKNLVSGEVNIEGAQLISAQDFEAINKRSKVDFGDLLMPMIGTIGNPVIVDHIPSYAIKNVALIKFERDAQIHNKYLLQLLRSDFFKWATAQKSRGGTQKFLALKDIRGIQIPLPPVAQQLKFSAWFDQNQVHRAKLKAAEVAAEALFLSLQRSAFNDEITLGI